MPSPLLPSHLALHVLLLLVLSPGDVPTPPPSPNNVHDSFDQGSGYDDRTLPPAYSSALLHLLLRELLAPSQPPLAFQELCDEVRALDPATSAMRRQGKGTQLARIFKAELQRLTEVAAFFDFVRCLQALATERDEDIVGPGSPPLDRRSPLGLAVRRFVLLAHSLDFKGVIKTLEALQVWVIGVEEGSSAEANPDPRLSAFQSYLGSLHRGAYQPALSSLQKFFSYPLPAPAPSDGVGEVEGRHHHALLNLAAFHLGHEELDSARLNVDEAIRLSRAANDRSALEKCISLSRRINAFAPVHGRAGREDARRDELRSPGDGEAFETLNGADQLFEITRRMKRAAPVDDIQRLMYTAAGTLDREEFPPEPPAVAPGAGTASDNFSRPLRQDVETGGWEALAASVWSAMGQERLATIREDALLGLAGDANEWGDSGQDAKLACVQSQALRLARNGRPIAALHTLLDPPAVHLPLLSLAAYHRWAHTAWSVLDIWASREGNEQARELIDDLRSTPALKQETGDAEENEGLGGRERIERELQKAQRYKAAHLPALALPLLLAAQETARSLALYGAYRTCTVALADAMLDLGEGEAQFASGLVDEVYAQILGGQDEELKAFASLTKARAVIVGAPFEAGPARDAALDLASSYLKRSLSLYAALSSSYATDPHLLALRLAAQLAHASSRSQERDQLAAEWEAASVRRQQAGGEVERAVQIVARGVMDLGIIVSLGLGSGEH